MRMQPLTPPSSRDFLSFQCASTPSSNPCAANHSAHPRQLLLKLSTMLKKHFFNPFSQVHERFNGHP